MLIPIQSKLSKEQATPEYLGGKGYGLHWMVQQGVNVPPALIIPTTACTLYMQDPKAAMQTVAEQMGFLKQYFTEAFGYMPLLSVRSGARVSMPGMMDTILNVGLHDSTIQFWKDKLGEACAENSYERLCEMYGKVVLGLPGACSNEVLPTPDEQVLGAVEAVFKSWNNDRAVFYRKMHNIPGDWGTAVVVQAMVFGNLNDNSGTGVLFTRNPDTGDNVVTGEFLVNAQGEDVVAGTATPMPLSQFKLWNATVAEKLMKAVTALEKARKDVQDVEFTIQDGELFILQTRNAKRTAAAAIRIALDMHAEGLLTASEAVKRVTPRDFDIAQTPVLDPKFKGKPDFTGLSACSGVAVGVPVFSAAEAIKCKVPCILISEETTPDDIAGMDAAVGVITMTGGATSHAAVVARGMNKPCVVGVGQQTEAFKGAAVVSFDGATGRIWIGKAVPVIDGSNSPAIREFRQLVIKTAGVTPVLSQPAEGVDELMLDLGGIVHDADEVLARVHKATGLSKRVYVDLRATGRTPAEDAFHRMFFAAADVETEVVKVLAANLSDEQASKVVLLTNSKLLKPFKSLGTAKDLRSLVLADGEAALEPGEKLDLKDPAVAKVVAWKQTEGFKTVAVGHVRKDSKSFVSPEQAFQLMG